MGDREIEKYLELAKYDYKCLENDMVRSSKLIEDGDIKTVLDELFKIVNESDKKLCQHKDKSGEIIECKYSNECAKLKLNYDMWKMWKEEKENKKDPDDSNGNNPYVRAIYYILWGRRIGCGDEFDINDKRAKVSGNNGSGVYEYGYTNFRTSYLSFKEDVPSKSLLWGGDTINTLASYRVQIERLKEENSGENPDNVNILCSRCHQLGNFVLVPAYFNGWRGIFLQDRMDLSLYILSEISNEGDENVYDGFSFKSQFLRKQKNSEKATRQKKWEVAETHFLVWENTYFNKYINTFFLWDYVEPDEKEKYVVKNLQYSENKQEDSKYITANTISTYIDHANKYIERRGIFMAAILKIASMDKDIEYTGKYKNLWQDWSVSGIYKYMIEKIFLTDTVFSGYQEVIKDMEGVLEELENIVNIQEAAEQVKAILGEIRKKLL